MVKNKHSKKNFLVKIKKMSIKELQAYLKELHKEWMKAEYKVRQGGLARKMYTQKDPVPNIKNLRKNIARAKTVLYLKLSQVNKQ